MEIQKFYKCEGFYHDFDCFDGRWKWKANLDEFTLGMDNLVKLEFTDCFGKHDEVIFNFDKPTTAFNIQTILPLISHFILLECEDNLDEDLRYEIEPPISRWILELDWSSKTCKLGGERFTCELLECTWPLEGYLKTGYSKIDRAFSNSKDEDLYFLIHRKDEDGTQFNCIHCKINTENLQFQQLGSNFQLPMELFNCIDLNGHVISGFSTSLDVITHFDLNSRQLLASSKRVYGLPPSICLDLGDNHRFRYIPAIGAWTSKHLYLWSEEKNRKKMKHIRHISMSLIWKLEWPKN